eukprot:126525-Chlamydomonas_euryale.AAC.2
MRSAAAWSDWGQGQLGAGADRKLMHFHMHANRPGHATRTCTGGHTGLPAHACGKRLRRARLPADSCVPSGKQ